VGNAGISKVTSYTALLSPWPNDLTIFI